MNKKVCLIVCCCLNNGIGKNGKLPWKLSNELKHFAKITTTCKDTLKQNAIIMGHKTWLSIPKNFKPLNNRVNIVLSKNNSIEDMEKNENKKPHYVFNNLLNAIDFLNNQENIEKIFIIGGEQIYKLAMDLNLCERIYLTKIFKEFECDVFFPAINNEKFDIVETNEVLNGIQQENDLKYEYLVYEKKKEI